MEISSLNSPVDASRVPLERLAASESLSEAEKIKEVARQFEAILLRQMLKEAQKTVIKSSMTDDSVSAGIYQDMVTNQMADAISQAGGFGFAQSLERDLNRQTSRSQPDEEDNHAVEN